MSLYRTRIFYQPLHETEKSGFYFCVLEVTAGLEEGWSLEETEVKVLYYGTVTWDGMRHFYQGHPTTNNYGYLYYPNLPRLINIMIKLRELEVLYCSEYED
ncbi:MAG: hypothetical protein AAFO02_20870 [Bacteroidota bacterium]